MTPEGQETLRRQARRAYEFGRLRGAVVSAALMAGTGAVLGHMLVGPRAALWAPVTFAIWCLVSFRGGILLRGAHYGLVAGALTFLMPLSVLRPCCRWDASGMGSCTMPEMCVAMGALVGLPLSAWALSLCQSRRIEAGIGVWLGVISMAAFKCSALFAGEAVGLFAGAALGVVLATALGSTRQRAPDTKS